MSHLWDIWGAREKQGIVRAESRLWDIYGTYNKGTLPFYGLFFSHAKVYIGQYLPVFHIT